MGRAFMSVSIPLEPHVEFPLTKGQYDQMRSQNPDMWRKCLFSPSRQLGYLLDPDNDERDRALMERRTEDR